MTLGAQRGPRQQCGGGWTTSGLLLKLFREGVACVGTHQPVVGQRAEGSRKKPGRRCPLQRSHVTCPIYDVHDAAAGQHGGSGQTPRPRALSGLGGSATCVLETGEAHMTGDRPNEPKGQQMSVQHGPPVQQSSPVQLGAGQSRASADEHRPGLLPEVLRVSYNDRELRVVRDAAQPTGLTASGFLAVAGLAFAGTRVSPPTSTERALLSEALRLGAVLTESPSRSKKPPPW